VANYLGSLFACYLEIMLEIYLASYAEILVANYWGSYLGS
jgi:hypothetical protein